VYCLRDRISKALFEATPEEIKCFEDSENKKILKEFAKDVMKDELNTFLFIKKTGTKDFLLTRDTAKAAMAQDKVLTVFRAGIEPVTRDNKHETLMFNEMRKTDLDQMRRTLEEVFIPAFSFKAGVSDEGNLRNWSQKSREDMIDKLSSMSVETKAIEGQVLGNTELPLPIASYMDSLQPKDKKQIYEVIITKWKKLVKKVLKQDSESIFDADQKAGPLEEIKFWDKRKDNLNYIYEQLVSKEVVEVKTFLTSQSSH